MKILIISYLFPPLNNPQSILSARLVKYLKKLGQDIDVIAANNVIDYESSHGEDESIKKELKDVKIMYINDKNPSLLFKVFWSKLVNQEYYKYWVKRCIRFVKSNNEKYDIIYSLSAPHASIVLGREVKKILNIPLVVHFSDPGYIALKPKFKSKIKNLYLEGLENKIMEDASAITFVNSDTLEAMTKYSTNIKTKSIIIPHFYDPDYFNDYQNYNNDCIKNRIIFSYVGSLYGKRKPFNTITALDTAFNCYRKDYQFNIYGNIERNIKNEIERIKNNKINIVGSVSYIESIKAMVKSDYLILIDMPDSNNLVTPSKLIDYMACKKPIIGITAKNTNTYRILNKIGYPCSDPNDINYQVDIFKSIINTPLTVTSEHLSSLEKYNANVVIENLVKYFEKLII